MERSGDHGNGVVRTMTPTVRWLLTGTLNWSAVTGATHYVLTEQVGSSWPERSSGSARTFAVSGKPNGSYTYRVVACQGIHDHFLIAPEALYPGDR